MLLRSCGVLRSERLTRALSLSLPLWLEQMKRVLHRTAVAFRVVTASSAGTSICIRDWRAPAVDYCSAFRRRLALSRDHSPPMYDHTTTAMHDNAYSLRSLVFSSLTSSLLPSFPPYVYFKRLVAVLVWFCAQHLVAKNWRITKTLRFPGGPGSPLAEEAARGKDTPQPPTRRADDEMDADQALPRGGVKVRYPC